jgi:hypothetical protein
VSRRTEQNRAFKDFVRCAALDYSLERIFANLYVAKARAFSGGTVEPTRNAREHERRLGLKISRMSWLVLRKRCKNPS